MIKSKVIVAKIIDFCFEYHFFLVTILTSLLYFIRELYSLICEHIRLTQVIFLLFIFIWSILLLVFVNKNEKEIYLLVSQISIIILFAEYFIESQGNQHSLFFFCQLLYQRLCIQWGHVRQRIVLVMSLLTLIYILIRINFKNDNWNELGVTFNTKCIIINFFALIIPLGMKQVVNQSTMIDISTRKLNQDLQQISNQVSNDGQQPPTVKQEERKQSKQEDQDGKNAKIQFLSNFIQQDLTFINDKYQITNKYNINKSPTQQYNQQRYQQQFLDRSSTSDAHYQMNQNTSASILFNHQDNKKQSRILNLVEEASDNFSLGVAIFNSKKDLIYYNQCVQQEFLNGCSSKINIKQGILSYCLDIKNISYLALKYSNQKDKNRSGANSSKIESQLNRSLSLGATATGIVQQNSFINGVGCNSYISDNEDLQLNENKEQKKRIQFDSDDQNQVRLFRSEQTNDLCDT